MISILGRRAGLALALSVAVATLSGCHPIPVSGDIRADARVNGALNGTFEVKIPPAPDPGPVVPVVVRPGPAGSNAARIALVDVDGLILDQNQGGLLSAGENPVSIFREKLEACARDPRVRAVVLRVNSPGGGVGASDTLAEELRRFRIVTGKPVVAFLMDLAAGGGYYLAVGSDLVVATPNGVVGGVGALYNYISFKDSSQTYNITPRVIKSGEHIDLGTVNAELTDSTRELLEEMVESYAGRFRSRVAALRPAMTEDDRKTLFDGRIMTAPKALALHAVDKLGYIDDAIADAEALIGPCGAEVVMFQRANLPIHSIYSVTPVSPAPSDLLPLSLPGLERSKLPTFLYLWQPDPTLVKTSGR